MKSKKKSQVPSSVPLQSMAENAKPMKLRKRIESESSNNTFIKDHSTVSHIEKTRALQDSTADIFP